MFSIAKYSPHPEGQSVQLHHGLNVELEKQPIPIEIFRPHPSGLLDLSGLYDGLCFHAVTVSPVTVQLSSLTSFLSDFQNIGLLRNTAVQPHMFIIL